MKMTTKLKAQINAVVDGFVVDKSTDYARMNTAITQNTGLALDRNTIWSLVNRAGSQVERLTFDMSDLD